MKINRTVQRALTVLSLVAKTPKGMTLSEMEGALDIPKTSLYDIVSTLEYMHYLRKHGKKYFIGFRPRDIGRAYYQVEDLCDVAEPILADASERLNVSSSLVLLSKNKLDYCFQYHPEDTVEVARRPSPYNFLHASATGKVLLAFMPRTRCESLLKIVLHRFTDNTVRDLEELHGELEKTREQGYGLDDREYNYQQQCVAAPIQHRGKVIAAISFTRLNLFNDDPTAMVKEVLATAKEISASYERL